MKNLLIIPAVLSIFLLISCNHEPEPIEFGHDECVLCKMSITDEKYGAEIVNKNGKTFKFDALECMAKYIADEQIDKENIYSIWTIDYTNPRQLINAESAYYLRARSLPSPMAMFLTSFPDMESLNQVKTQHPGDELNWNEVVETVKEEWH
ncbi:MAG: nitrous oxide reductase accessory protein NosL [Candidatus Kapaibacterium sp.]|jgi:copper chaperone NosL|nr:nitrous oxide reductase accessory protein NosL [Candidatus Kapabacteria bacterium]